MNGWTICSSLQKSSCNLFFHLCNIYWTKNLKLSRIYSLDTLDGCKSMNQPTNAVMNANACIVALWLKMITFMRVQSRSKNQYSGTINYMFIKLSMILHCWNHLASTLSFNINSDKKFAQERDLWGLFHTPPRKENFESWWPREILVQDVLIPSV